MFAKITGLDGTTYYINLDGGVLVRERANNECILLVQGQPLHTDMTADQVIKAFEQARSDKLHERYTMKHRIAELYGDSCRCHR